jgi:hypothetical protein
MIDATTIAVIRKMISKYCGASSSDVNAIIKKYLQDNPVTASSIGAETTSDATTKYNSLNKLINDLQTKLNNIADSDDETLDQFSELVTYIKNNKSLIDQLQTILEKSEQHKVDKSVLYDVLHNTPHADTVGDFFDLRRTGKIYRTRFYTFAKNPTCKGTKLLDNAGLQYEPSTDTVEGKDDYLNGEHPLFEWYNCNYKRNADGTAYPTAIEGEDGYTTTGNVDVGVIQPSFYYNFEINTEEGYIDVTISDMPHTLRTDIVLYPWNECLQADGTVLPWCIGSKYISSIGDDGLLRSLPDRQPEGNASYETMITDYQKKGAGYWGAGAERNTFQIIFILIKGATKNSQSLFAGCTDYYIKLPVSIKNTGESVYVTTNKDASAFFVGAPVYVGHNGGDGHVVIDIAPTKVIKIEPIDSNNTAIYLDVKNESFISTAGVDIDETEYLVSIPWYSGTTDNVIGKHDGSMISNSNSKYPYRVQGREYSIGLQMVASDTVTVLKDDSTRDVYVAPRGTHHTTDESNIKKNYNLIGSIPAQENTSPEYWVGDIKINTNTGVWFPSYQGSGDSQGFADCIIGDDVCLLSSYVYGGFARVGSYGGFVSLECTIWYDETNGFEASAD